MAASSSSSSAGAAAAAAAAPPAAAAAPPAGAAPAAGTEASFLLPSAIKAATSLPSISAKNAESLESSTSAAAASTKRARSFGQCFVRGAARERDSRVGVARPIETGATSASTARTAGEDGLNISLGRGFLPGELSLRATPRARRQSPRSKSPNAPTPRPRGRAPCRPRAVGPPTDAFDREYEISTSHPPRPTPRASSGAPPSPPPRRPIDPSPARRPSRVIARTKR